MSKFCTLGKALNIDALVGWLSGKIIYANPTHMDPIYWLVTQPTCWFTHVKWAMTSSWILFILQGWPNRSEVIFFTKFQNARHQGSITIVLSNVMTCGLSCKNFSYKSTRSTMANENIICPHKLIILYERSIHGTFTCDFCFVWCFLFLIFSRLA